MRSSFVSTLASVVLAVSASSILGCAAEMGAGDDPAVSALNERVLTNVGAVDLADFGSTTEIAAPAKIKKLVAALKSPREGSLRCLPLQHVTFYGKDGKRMASLGLGCDASESSVVEASLSVERSDGLVSAPSAKSYIVKIDTETLKTIAEAPAAVGDLLHGVDKVDLGRFGATPVSVERPRP